MSRYSIVFKDKASADATKAFLYYEEQQPGLGEKFLRQLQHRTKQLSEDPEHYSFISASRRNYLRDVKIKGFPYVIIFNIKGQVVTVYVVHNTYRKSKRR